MKKERVSFHYYDQMVVDKRGREYFNVDCQTTSEEVLSEVNKILEKFGLEIVLGEGIDDDQTYFTVKKIFKRKPKKFQCPSCGKTTLTKQNIGRCERQSCSSCLFVNDVC